MPNIRKHRRLPDAPTGSMADIAFLLLIFFLLTTTILNESGLLVRLPQWSYQPPIKTDWADRNTLVVALNRNNELLVEGNELPVHSLREKTVEFVLNPNANTQLAISPDKAVISLAHDRSTNYEAYLEVYNELLAAYRICRDRMARQRYDRDYEELPVVQQRIIRELVPQIISEAEPTDYEED